MEVIECPHCGHPIGEHTINGFTECCQASGLNYHLPHEEIPGGPIVFPHIEGHLSSEVNVAAAVLDSDLGPVPAIRFIFTAPGALPMQRVQLPPVTFIGTPDQLALFVEMVDNAAALAVTKSVGMR